MKDKNKIVRTRIDRMLADSRILDRITDIDIIDTKVSDHNAITWSIETHNKSKRAPYNKIPTEIIIDK